MTVGAIDHATLRRLVAEGAVETARAVGQTGGWLILVPFEEGRVLAAQRSGQVRLFRRMETLVGYLKSIGIARFDVDATSHSAGPETRAKRPDRADALRDAHQALGHDRWFREQVAEAVREADDPDTAWLSQDEARKEWAARRADHERRSATRARS